MARRSHTRYISFPPLSDMCFATSGWFPLKMKDEIQVVGSAFGYLRSKGLLVDDDEDDGIDMAALGGME